MPTAVALRGTWTGRIVDLQGFEGEVTLRLDQDRKSGGVMGAFDVAFGGQHDSIRQRGSVEGRAKGDQLTLEFELGEKSPVRIAVSARVWKLKAGGLGLCGTYQVAARAYSPLQGGVLALNSGVPLTSTAIATTSSRPIAAPAPAGRRSK